MRPIFFLLFIIASCLALAQHQNPASQPFLPGGTDKWELIRSGEFNGSDKDLDQRWISQNGPSGHILCSRWRENVTVTNGLLQLVARKEKNGGQDWTAGSIWTREMFQYSYFECRYRYAAADGLNNSFWLMPTSAKKIKRGKFFEIDFNEGHFPNKVNNNIHNHSDTPKSSTISPHIQLHPADLSSAGKTLLMNSKSTGLSGTKRNWSSI